MHKKFIILIIGIWIMSTETILAQVDLSVKNEFRKKHRRKRREPNPLVLTARENLRDDDTSLTLWYRKKLFHTFNGIYWKNIHGLPIKIYAHNVFYIDVKKRQSESPPERYYFTLIKRGKKIRFEGKKEL